MNSPVTDGFSILKASVLDDRYNENLPLSTGHYLN